MYDRENDNRTSEGRQVQQELEDQLRAFGDTMTDAFAHGFEGRGMDIGDRAWMWARQLSMRPTTVSERLQRPSGDGVILPAAGWAALSRGKIPPGCPAGSGRFLQSREPTPVESIRISAKTP